MGNFECEVAPPFMDYNFGRTHKNLRLTPAMEAEICGHIWPFEEIAKLAD